MFLHLPINQSLNPQSLVLNSIRNDLTMSSLQDIIECIRVYESNSRVDKRISEVLGYRIEIRVEMGDGESVEIVCWRVIIDMRIRVRDL